MILLKEKLCLLKYLKIKDYDNISYYLMRFLSKHITWPQDIEGTHSFFVALYDEIYHELLFKQIHIQKNILRIFERLALPFETATPEQCREIYQRILMITSDALKKKHRLQRTKSLELRA